MPRRFLFVELDVYLSLSKVRLFSQSVYVNEGTQALGFVTQVNQKEFSITIVTRNLRNNNGAYEYLDKVKAELSGFQIDECTSLIPTKDFFISENKGIWQYGINFTLKTQNIQTI